ncbi:MAG TPA: hypothetical protein VM733_12310 [Thermoanaerobaculia bacterium]|nr:hypothetical protein [Thermoanaerobaculia bacterium]
MKGCARTCILWLVGWIIAAGAFFYYFRGIRDFGPPTYWAAIGAGLSVVLCIGYAWGIGQAYRERAMLMGAMAGTPPVDGKWAAVSGTIHSSAPIAAPISGLDSVTYEYKIYRHERSGRNSSEVTYFDGKALTPSTIATRSGSVRLLSVPSFQDVEPTEISWTQAVANAKAYVSSTEFRLRETDKNAVEEESTDDDGQYRRDRRHSTNDVDLADDFRFEEKRIAQGEQVCAFGLYSRERGGLIPHPNWANQTRLMRGNSLKVADKLRTRMIKYAFGVIILGAIPYAIWRFYLYQAATLP